MNVLLCKFDTTELTAQWILDRADKVYLILDDFDASRDLDEATVARMEKVYYVSSFDSIDELAAVAVDLMINDVRIDRIATFTEFSQYGAGYLAGLLGVENYSTALALNTRDKRQMKRLARQSGLRTASFASISGAVDADIEGIEATVGYPLVIKPVNGLGTMSTARIDDRTGLEAFLASYSTRPEIRSRQLIAEEYISGEELHIDAVWRDGEAWMLFVSRYFVPLLRQFSEGGLNGSVLLNEEDYAELYSQVATFHATLNGALGIRDGATHLEVFWDRVTGELTFSEIATRFGGGGIFELIGHKCGTDQRQIWAHEVCGQSLSELPLRESPYKYLGVLQIEPKTSGTITELPTEALLLAHPGVLSAHTMKSVGDEIDLHCPNVWCVIVFLGANSEEALVATAQDLSRRFPVRVAACEPVVA